MTGWHHAPMTAFDIESTGLDVENERVVTIAVAHIAGRDQGHAVEVRHGLIAIDIDIHPDAVAIHGITTEHARANGKPAADVLDFATGELALALSRGTPVVGMNLSFDWTLLDRECRRWGVPTIEDRLDGKPIAPVIDVYVIDRALDTYRPGRRKLENLCEHYGVRLDGAHDSTQDALAAARIAYRIACWSHQPAVELRKRFGDRRYPDRLVRAWRRFAELSLPELHAKQAEWHATQAEGLDEYWTGLAHKAALVAERAAERFTTAADQVARDEADQERMAAEAEIADLKAKVASLSTHWPIRPTAQEATR